MKEFEGKTLLILGGNALTCDIVTKAQELGIYTIVTDWNTPEASPAKRIADEYWMESLSNTEKLAQMVKERHIDGVFTNYTDSYLPFYARLCEATGLPCLATEEQMEVISNKDQSKQLCIDHGISVSKRYQVSSIEDIDNLTDITFPVLTKPVDNSGQRGVFVCRDRDELKKLYEASLQFSLSKNVMIEEYVQGDYTVMFYTIQNGYVTLSTMADKPVIGEFVNNLPKLPQGYFLPSKYIGLCKEIMVPKVQSFVTDLGIKNGVIGIDHHDFVLKENGMDILAMLIRFALTGEFAGWDASVCDNPQFNNCYCSLNVLIQPDKVARVEGLDEVKSLSQVINFTQMMEEGDSVKLPGTVQQILFKFLLVENSWDALRKIIEKIYGTIHVYNEHGGDIVIQPTYFSQMLVECP